ncbi:hypothetical protein CTI12_AA614710 [Artemisia annua]|uniref:Uncharacterized protein n=1 Tax=Artemisia annua TaxID=35608 RepID=A0A2U1KDA3_ARTAN|nr:hypothetical protein CTI12_AA614710 [Artemisia annua]
MGKEQNNEPSVNIMYDQCFKQLHGNVRKLTRPATIPLIGLSSEISIPEGYRILFDRTTIQQLWSEVSTIRSHVQFPTKSGIATIKSNYPGKDMELAATVDNMTIKEIREALPR